MNQFQADQALTDAMGILEQKQWVLRVDQSAKAITWAIDPKLAKIHGDYRKEVIKARQRQNDRRTGIAQVPRIFVKGYQEGWDIED